MRLSHFTEATAYQCGTITRNGAPWSGPSGSPFIEVGDHDAGAGSATCSNGSDRTKVRSSRLVSGRTGFRW